MARWRIDCRAADYLLSQARDTRLPPARRWALWWHLRFCDACRSVQRNFAVLARVTRRLGD